MIFDEKYKATDIGYINVRDAKDDFCIKEREYTEALWEKFKGYSDSNFLKEIRVDFDARYWEMYLAVSLFNEKWKVECPKPGPDVALNLNGSAKLWIEAIAPSGGTSKNPDKVHGIKPGVIQGISDEGIILRLRNAIEEKYKTKYLKYRDKNTVSENDPYIIAINTSKMDSAHIEMHIPRIVKSVLPFGYAQLTKNPHNPEKFIESTTYRDNIKKKNGVEISTDIFLKSEYEGLSGVLCSNVSFGRRPNKMGEDYILVHNPNAKNPCPHGLLGIGMEYTVELSTDKIELSQKDWNTRN